MNYLTREDYEQARSFLPDPNTSNEDHCRIEIIANGKDSKTEVYFIRVLYCDSARIDHKEYKWLLDKRVNIMA